MTVPVTAVAMVGVVATTLMVLAMLGLVWMATKDERHQPYEPDRDV